MFELEMLSESICFLETFDLHSCSFGQERSQHSRQNNRQCFADEHATRD